MQLIPVILSGGSGTRLWPLSRESYPKQFLSLFNDRSLFQNTVRRVSKLPGATAPLVVCSEQHRFIVAEQLVAMDVEPLSILLEPEGRNTAPAVLAAALFSTMFRDNGRADDALDILSGDAVLLVLPSDHLLKESVAFYRALKEGMRLAAEGHLVTFGMTPRGPETGFGYVVAGESLGEGDGRQVRRFVEKPDRATAERLLADGECYWNSGMFMFRASAIMAEANRHVPRMLQCCRRALAQNRSESRFVRLDPASFARCENTSLDYAIMEKSERVVVVPCESPWTDLGSWEALWALQCDKQGNRFQGDTVDHDSRGCYVRAEHRLVATLGLKDVVVVETEDAVLVADRHRVQEIKQVVGQLKARRRREAHTHNHVLRPWGAYRSIQNDDRFQVKRITVKPGAKLSLQMHHHRAEHWIVVRGTARVTCGDRVFILSENESTYIPLGVKHRLENPGRIPLELIEIQTGSYLEEDDIVRFDDVYGRDETGAGDAAPVEARRS